MTNNELLEQFVREIAVAIPSLDATDQYSFKLCDYIFLDGLVGTDISELTKDKIKDILIKFFIKDVYKVLEYYTPDECDKESPEQFLKMYEKIKLVLDVVK
jgi:hypothetical protein